jgi:hypothetical protein
MMLPNTASSLRESKRNSLKDFVSVAGPLGVSHFLMLTATEKATYLRVAKAPRVSGSTAAALLEEQHRSYCSSRTAVGIALGEAIYSHEVAIIYVKQAGGQRRGSGQLSVVSTAAGQQQQQDEKEEPAAAHLRSSIHQDVACRIGLSTPSGLDSHAWLQALPIPVSGNQHVCALNH